MVLRSVSTPCGNIYRQPWQPVKQFSEVYQNCPNHSYTVTQCNFLTENNSGTNRHTAWAAQRGLAINICLQGVPQQIDIMFLAAIAALYVTMSVGRSVGWLVGPLVCPSPTSFKNGHRGLKFLHRIICIE